MFQFLIICVVKRTYLSRHHFRVSATDLNTSIEAGPVMGLHDVSAICLVSSDTAVVWS